MKKKTHDKPEEVFIKNISQLLKDLRKHRKMTQEELGLRIGKDKTQISKIENGTRNLTMSTILSVVEALGAELTISIKTKNNEK